MTGRGVPITRDPSDHGVAFLALAYTVMVHSQSLCSEVDDPSLTWSEGPAERKFVPHAILLEHEDTGVDLQRRGIVEVEFVLS